MTSFKFVDNFDVEPKDVTTSYYQIATYPDPHTKLFHVRKFVINGSYQFKNTKEYHITKINYHKLLKIKKSNEYKLYPVFNLNIVQTPQVSDLLLLKSDMFNNNDNSFECSQITGYPVSLINDIYHDV